MSHEEKEAPQAAAAATALPSKALPSTYTNRLWQNWSRNHSTHIAHLLTPITEADIVDCVHSARLARATLKVLGAGHSLSVIAVPDGEGGWPMSLHKHNRILSVDHDRLLVRAEAGCTLKALSAHLHSVGLAIALLGSISEQTLAGAIQTGTHPTGARYGPVHTQVHSFVVITGQGERLELSADDPAQSELFQAMVVGLGVMGVVSEVTLRVVPLFRLREVTYGLSWDDMLAQLPQLVHGNDRLKLLYFPLTEHVGVWTANPVDDDDAPNNTSPPASVDAPCLPVRPPTPEPNDPFIHADPNAEPHTMSAAASDEAGPSKADVAAIRRDNEKEYRSAYWRRMTRTDIAKEILNCDCGAPGGEYATEAAFPFSAAREVLIHWRHVIDSQQLPARGNIEIRVGHADPAWMSTSYQPAKQCEEDTAEPADAQLFLYIAVNWVLKEGEGRQGSEGEGYIDVFQREVVRRFGGRQHWGKMGKLSGEDVRRRYERWDDFRRLRARHDSDGVFLNAFTREVLLLPTPTTPKTKRGVV